MVSERALLNKDAPLPADLAGGLRMQYPPDVKVVQLPCTGKLDVLLTLQAF